MHIVNGQFIPRSEKKVALVASRFNEFIVQKLIGGAEDALLRHGIKENDITLYWCPGAFEIPAVAGRVAASKSFDAVICLGAVIRGSTPHFDYVSNEVAKGVAQVGLQNDIPVLFGVLTTDDLNQAIERAGSKAGNKGYDAAMTALEMMDLYEKI